MTQVENSRLAGAGERAPMLSRGWDPRVRILARLLEGLRYGSLSVTLPSGPFLITISPNCFSSVKRPWALTMY